MSDPYDLDTATVRSGAPAGLVPALEEMTAALEDLTAISDGHGSTDLNEQLAEPYTTVVEVALRIHQRYIRARRCR